MSEVAKAAELVQPLAQYPPHEYEIRFGQTQKNTDSGVSLKDTRTNSISLKFGLGKRLESISTFE